MTLEFKIARALSELEEIYKLRYQIYLSVGYIAKGDYPDEKEMDDYDQISTHFYAFSKEENKVVGAIRLINDFGKLPVEELYDLSFLRQPNKKVVEVSRRITLPNRVKANLGLIKIICQYAKANKITDFIFSANPADIDFYDKLGCIQFGELKHYPKMNMPAIGLYIEVEKFKEPYNRKLFEPDKTVFVD